MRKIILFVGLFLVFCLQSFANKESVLTYTIGAVKVDFVDINGVVVSKNCQESQCLALMKYKEFKNAELNPEWLVGGRNPRSVKCHKLMEGTVLISLDKDGNEQSVCLFKDGSYLR